MKHTRKNRKRRPYRGIRAADPGSCDYCRANRLYAQRRQAAEAGKP